MKEHFNKELVMIEKDYEYFENSTKCWICGNAYVDGDVKVTDHGKYRGSAHRDCNIQVKWNHKIPFVFRNLKNYISHLIMQELDKLNFKINVIENRLEKYILSLISSFLLIASNF